MILNKPQQFCTKPFDNLEFHLKGDVFFCCPTWLKTSIGNLNTSKIEDVWNSSSAQKIRESIIDGSYRYCDKKACPYLSSSSLNTFETLSPQIQNYVNGKKTHLDKLPENIMLDYDLTCNLSCPSCRNKTIVISPNSPEYEAAEKLTTKIHNEFIHDLGNGQLTLNITGSGDPFASTIFKNYLASLNGSNLKNLKIDLQTNGTLLNEEMWSRFSNIHSNINRLFVSIDAATEETYHKVRRGGSWDVLLSNMKFLVKLRQTKKIQLLQARFVVQKSNFFEMEPFAKLFLSLGCDTVEFSLLSDWGTWSEQEFKEQNIATKEHSDFKRLLDFLASPSLNHPRIFLGNLKPLQDHAIKNKLEKSSRAARTIYLAKCSRQKIINALINSKIQISKAFNRFFES